MASSYQVEFTKSAKKEFDRLSYLLQNNIIEALEVLSRNPFSEILKTKKLKGPQALYRLRLGDYRVVYEIRQNTLVILIIKIGHRKEVYRNLSNYR